MLKSIFYIPASNRKFFSAFSKYKPDYFVLDLEDSIATDDIINSIDFIVNFDFQTTVPVFVRLWNLNPSIIIDNKRLFEKFNGFILPKVESIEQINNFINVFNREISDKKIELILLIETPEGVANAESILKTNKGIIAGVGFGSHDFCNCVGAKHNTKYFSYPRNLVLFHGKLNNLLCVDIASTNISDDDEFINECIEGYNMGFDAKPVLHPHQLELLDKIVFFSEVELLDAKELKEIYRGLIPSEISAIKHNGKIIEKPHIQRLNKIIDYLKKH